MSASSVAAIATAISDRITTEYISAAASTVYLYDILLTWDDEVSKPLIILNSGWLNPREDFALLECQGWLVNKVALLDGMFHILLITRPLANEV